MTHRSFKVPGQGFGTVVATPHEETILAIFGSKGAGSFEGVTYTQSQIQNLRKFYGYEDRFTDAQRQETLARMETAYEVQLAEHKKKETGYYGAPTPPKKPTMKDAEDSLGFLAAGDERNLFRYVSRDGRRIMGLLARYLQNGEDPVKLVANLLMEAGYDVDSEIVDWAQEDIYDIPEDGEEAQV